MVQCCPMHASCTFPHPEKRDYGGAFCGRCGVGRKVFGSNEEKIGPRGLFLFLHTFPKSVAVAVPTDHLACIANPLKPTVQPVFRCFGDAIHACVQMAAAVVCLPQTVRRGRDIVRCMWQLMAAWPEEEGIVFQMSTFRP